MSIDAHATEDGSCLSMDSRLSRTLIVGTSPLIDWAKVFERLQIYNNSNHQTNNIYFAIGIHPYFIRDLVLVVSRNRRKQNELNKPSDDHHQADALLLGDKFKNNGDMLSSKGESREQQVKNGFPVSMLNNVEYNKNNSTVEQDQEEDDKDTNANKEEEITPEDFKETLTIYMNEMETLLQANPALRVGEIGLDKTRKRSLNLVPLANQYEFFIAQFLLAGKYGRSVSIHCVRAHGTLLEFFRELDSKGGNTFPRGIYLHSWSGSPQLTGDLLRLKSIGPLIYFGFSFKINYGRLHPYQNQDKNIIPIHRVLTESDAGLGNKKRAENVQVISEQVEAVLGVSSEMIEQNFLDFIHLMSVQ